jgi:amino acid adenylation domain-containing protein
VTLMREENIQGFRLTPQQKHLWRLREAPHAEPFRAQCEVRVEGELSPVALEAAAASVVADHEILRTAFLLPPGKSVPVQVIAEDGPPAFRFRDLSALDATAQAAAIRELTEEMGRAEFDLTRGPLLRLALCRLGSAEHHLVITVPSLCADAVGLKNLVAALARATAERGGSAGEVMQYADLAEWQNELLEAEEAEAGRRYWRGHDYSALSFMRLPSEEQFEVAPEFRPREVSGELDAALTTRLTEMSDALGVSPAMILSTCWQLLLWQRVGQPDVIVAQAFDGRSYEGLEDVLGLFARYLPVRARVETGARFDEVLRRADEAAREVYEWQEYFTWDQLEEAGGRPGARPFFPFCFEFVGEAARLEAGGLAFTPLSIDARIDRFKLKLKCAPRAGALGFSLQYDASLCGEEGARLLAEQFRQWVEGALADPHATIGALAAPGEDERRHVLFDLNRTGVEFGPAVCVHELFEAQAARTPDAAAVSCGDESLTYAELNGRANRLAHHLRSLGVGRGALVGLCVGRSVRMTVGVLAVLKSGGAYVPLDPNYPQDRLAFTLKDAGVEWLITEADLQERFAWDVPRVVRLDADNADIEQRDTHNPVAHVLPESLAYVIYTSGSTGEPKGAMVTHANLHNYVQAMCAALELDASDRYLHTASVGFSSSVRQLLVPLTHGAAVVVATDEQRLDPSALLAEVKQQGVTVVDLVPSHWRSLNQALLGMEQEQRGRLLDNRLRLILSASEPLSSTIPADWTRAIGHPARIINMFGQTETAGIVATHPLAAADLSAVKTVSVGRPIANSRIYILDQNLAPVRLGVCGDLYVGGDDVGRGYLNRPGLTAERFVPDPFALEPGARLYCTGDRALYAPDGQIEFLGRSDTQVKVRGFRVELGEVEAALCAHQAVIEAVVVAHPAAGDGARLVAYVVPRQDPAPSADGLQSFLGEKLPGYMIPSAFVIVESLPLTPNGKLDRRALAEANPSGLRPQAAYVAPRTPVEEALVRMWSQLLGVERVGVEDNFFKLGGHSLLGTVLVSRVRESFQVELPVLALFKSPTVAGLAVVIEQSLIAEADTESLSGILEELDGLSDEEILARLQNEGRQFA